MIATMGFEGVGRGGAEWIGRGRWEGGLGLGGVGWALERVWEEQSENHYDTKWELPQNSNPSPRLLIEAED